MSRILDFDAEDRVHEDDICAQAAISDVVAVRDVWRHLELIAAVPDGTGDALAARGAMNLINELAALAKLDVTSLGINVKEVAPWLSPLQWR